MLCPEVWNLKVTQNTVKIKNGIYESKEKQYVENAIRNHHYNQMVSLALPNCSESIPETIVNLIKDSDYYRLDNFDLKALLNSEFIEGFVKKGKFTALSSNSRNDIDNCFAVTGDGKLVLSIDKELYQSLGLEGRKSIGNEFKNIIKIDLTCPLLGVDKPYAERIRQALDHEAFTNQSLYFSWNPHNTSICPSSAAKYFNDQNHTVHLCHTKMKIQKQRSLRCPNYRPTMTNKYDDDAHDLVEYLAMRMLDCDLDGNEMLSSYRESSDVEEIDTATFIHCQGFFSATFVTQLFEQLRRNVCQPWSTLCVSGFQYSPLTFFNREHTFTSNGDNDYAIFVYPGNQFMFYQNSSSNKKLK